jgi:putative Ca2+/H+ antiporter (TMEM165/GDT1 family)
MEALFTSFLAAALAEWGDKTQLLVIALAVRHGQPGPILAGVGVGALFNALIASFGGSLIHDIVTLRAISLLVAVALIYAAISGFASKEPPEMGLTWKTGPFVTSAVCFFLLEFGDKTQFLTVAIAAQYDSIVLASAGATIGVLVASAPAAILGERLPSVLPMKPLRLGIASLFLLIGFIVAVTALRLI